MQELYNLVAQKTGLSAEQSKMAVDTVISYLKSKLPAPIASEVDAVLGGNMDLGSAAGMLGGLFK